MTRKDQESVRLLEKITELHAPEVPELNVYRNGIPYILTLSDLIISFLIQDTKPSANWGCRTTRH
jgi:hypothetical protein